MVFQGLRLALAGVAIGLAASFGLTRLMGSLLFGVEAFDPMVFSVVPVMPMGVALLAVWLPAIRASRIDPIHALTMRIAQDLGSFVESRSAFLSCCGLKSEPLV